LNLIGFHIYAGTQCLRADAIVESYTSFAQIFRRLCDDHDLAPQRLIFGSGLGIPYYESDQPLDVVSIGRRIAPGLQDLLAGRRFAGRQLVLETGRYLIGEAGLYLTRVISRKHSRGTEIAVCDGGMNHHLGAAGHLGTVIHRNYRMFKLGSDDAESRVAY